MYPFQGPDLFVSCSLETLLNGKNWDLQEECRTQRSAGALQGWLVYGLYLAYPVHKIIPNSQVWDAL